MYAIRNKNTHKWLFGTDFTYHPHRQYTSSEKVLTWETESDARIEFIHRECGKSYEVVPVMLLELEEDPA